MGDQVGEHGGMFGVVKRGEEACKDGLGLGALGVEANGFDLGEGEFLLWWTMEDCGQGLQCVRTCAGNGNVEEDAVIPSKTSSSLGYERCTRHGGEDAEIVGFAIAN